MCYLVPFKLSLEIINNSLKFTVINLNNTYLIRNDSNNIYLKMLVSLGADIRVLWFYGSTLVLVLKDYIQIIV